MERTLEKYRSRRPIIWSVNGIGLQAGLPRRRSQGKGRRPRRPARCHKQFRGKGIDASSEACGLPFIGEVSYFWHMMRVPRPVFEGDRRIPAVPFLIHGKADYAGSSAEGGHTGRASYAAFFSHDVTADTPMKLLTDAYYLIQTPLNA